MKDLISKEERISQMMKKLDLTREEALQLLEDDKEIDRMKDKDVDNDLTTAQKQTIKESKRADRTPTAYKFKTPTRKADSIKEQIITDLFTFLSENAENGYENAEITNKSRQIAFKVGEDSFELTLVRKSKPKK